jgi:hypothetical protein
MRPSWPEALRAVRRGEPARPPVEKYQFFHGGAVMLGLFSRSRRPRPVARPRPARLGVEQLETRYCLSQLGLTAMVLPGHQVQLSGSLSDSVPAGATVTFSGAASGSTTTDANGNYSFSTSTATLGAVSAVAVDVLGQSSNTAQATIAVAAPSLTLAISYGSQKTVTLSGTVSDMDASSLTVTFSGEVTGSVTPGTNGNFSYTAQAAALGTVSASTTDLWGQASNTAQVTVSCAAPQITNFAAILNCGTTWTLEGQVVANNAQGLVITFSNMPSLQGVTATVGSSGWFYVNVTFQPGEDGMACAETTDCWGQNSNVAETMVEGN